MVEAFGTATELAIQAGFDAVEIHAGHGYLISQFLSRYTNHRRDEYGGSLDNRMRFMRRCINAVTKAAAGRIAITAKMNTRDAVPHGMEVEDNIIVAKELQKLGVDGIVLSGGFVSKSPMYVMRGRFPVKAIAHYMPMKSQWWLKAGVLLGGRIVAPTVPFKKLFFMEDAMKFREAMPDMTFIYVGGVTSRESAETVLDNGFPLMQMARAVLEDTDFVNKMKADEHHCSECQHTNFCVGRMYTYSMACHKTCKDITPALERDVQKTIRINDKTERKLGYK